jgi:hypothetical protein
MDTNINEIYLNKLFDDLVQERNTIQLEFKNDKELCHTQRLTNQLSTLTSLINQVIKYRNLKQKIKMTSL